MRFSEALVALHDAVQGGIGDGDVSYLGVPMFHRQLTGNDGGRVSGASAETLTRKLISASLNRC